MDFVTTTLSFSAAIATLVGLISISVAAVIAFRGAFLTPAVAGKVVGTTTRAAGIKG